MDKGWGLLLNSQEEPKFWRRSKFGQKKDEFGAIVHIARRPQDNFPKNQVLSLWYRICLGFIDSGWLIVAIRGEVFLNGKN
jgi:hypothetical protein